MITREQRYERRFRLVARCVLWSAALWFGGHVVVFLIRTYGW